jgi:hypothetical protein
MWKRISDWLHRVSSGWVALAAVVVFVAFSVLVLPGQAAAAEGYGGEAGSPDTSFFYLAGDLYRMAEAYGEQGREAYVRSRFTFDLIFPVVYTLFLGIAISWLYGRAFPPGSPWRWANLAPVLGAVFDYLENVSASLVMARYPARTPVVDALAPVFTFAKWCFVGGSFALLLLGVGVGLGRWIRGRSSGSSV